MSDDIVERLRAQAWQRSGAPKMDAGHTKMLEWEAADEIERLKDDVRALSQAPYIAEEKRRYEEREARNLAEIELLRLDIKTILDLWRLTVQIGEIARRSVEGK